MKIKLKFLLGIIVILSAFTSCRMANEEIDVRELESEDLSRAHLAKNDVKNYIYDYINAYIKPINTGMISGYYVHNPGPGNIYHRAHISTSEAMGYGMRIVLQAYRMARTGREQAHWQSMFEGLWRVVHASSAHAVCSCCITENLTRNSIPATGSTTGDMEITYALILAHNLLGSSSIGGDIKNYEWHAMNKLKVMAVYNTQTSYIPSLNYDFTYLLIGNKHQEPESYWLNESGQEILNFGIESDLVTKPSDWNFHHFLVFLDFLSADKDSYEYNKFVDLRISAAIMFTINPFDSGLYPDFIKFDLNEGRSVSGISALDPNSIEAQYMIKDEVNTNIMSYNSCRVPLNLAMAYNYKRWDSYRFNLDEMYKTLHPGRDITQTGEEYYLNGTIKQNKFNTSFAAPIAATSLSRRYEGPWQSNRAAYYRINRDLKILITKKNNGCIGDAINLFSILLLTEFQFVPYE